VPATDRLCVGEAAGHPKCLHGTRCKVGDQLLVGRVEVGGDELAGLKEGRQLRQFSGHADHVSVPVDANRLDRHVVAERVLVPAD
jgi:hypothetical protein